MDAGSLFIGYTQPHAGTNGPRPLHLDPRDLESHVHGLGGTRTGKSKLIEWIARELVRRNKGFCLIDPHGFLYEDLVAWLAYIAPRREIVLFNPSSTGRIVGFNPFRWSDGDIGTRVDRLVRATVKAWGATGTDSTPRLERWLRCLYHTLLETRTTLEAMPFLFTWSQRQVGAYLTSAVTSDLIRNEWESLLQYTRPADFDEQLESSRNRLFRFLGSQQIRRVMGLDINNLDVEEIIEGGKILLVNLQPSDVLSEEQGRVLGTLLLNEIWEVGMRRRRRLAGRTPPSFHVILDEFHKFLTPDIPDMLDQAAKYGLHLMLFHQRLDQLRSRDEDAFSAVMTNARVKLVFGALSREDARTMVEQIYPGQVDLAEVKYVLEQTKFWPVYGRDVVRSTGQSDASAISRSSGAFWNPALGEWVASTATGDISQHVHQEGEADIPIYHPIPFREPTSVELFSLEEVLWRLADRLMEQYQRHFMVRRPGRPTEAAITPFVKPWSVTPERFGTYTESTLSRFLPSQAVDELLAKTRDELIRKAAAAAEPKIVPSTPKPRRPKEPKR